MNAQTVLRRAGESSQRDTRRAVWWPPSRTRRGREGKDHVAAAPRDLAVALDEQDHVAAAPRDLATPSRSMSAAKGLSAYPERGIFVPPVASSFRGSRRTMPTDV